MMDWNGHMTAAGWILMIVWTLIIVGLIAGVIYWLTSERSADERSDTSSREPSAKEILDRRLASGELTVEQYEQLHDTLTARSTGAGETRPHKEHAPAPG